MVIMTPLKLTISDDTNNSTAHNNDYDTLDKTPNRNLSPWGANDINQLVNQTKINHPEEKKVPSTPNAWTKPPRVRRTSAPHSYDEVQNNTTPKKRIQNNNTTKTINTEKHSTTDENIDGKELLAELKKMKEEIITQCSKMFDRERKHAKQCYLLYEQHTNIRSNRCQVRFLMIL